MDKNELIETINELARFVQADANTFLWAKSQKKFANELLQNNNSQYTLGGGNFFIALGSLSFLSLLSKIYEISTSDDCTNLFKDNVYGNETKAVRLYVTKINSNINIIENIGQIEKFWKLMRHGLVHCFLPKGGTSSLFSIGYLDFKTELNFYGYIQNLHSSNLSAITQNNRGGYDCNSDLLALKVVQGATWLSNYLAKNDITNKQLVCIYRMFY